MTTAIASRMLDPFTWREFCSNYLAHEHEDKRERWEYPSRVPVSPFAMLAKTFPKHSCRCSELNFYEKPPPRDDSSEQEHT